jgi:alkylation response protein AidB-like acyl-CoA dehydrogenase
MNKPVSTDAVRISQPLTADSPDLEALFDRIAQGEVERERDRVLPHEAVDLIRRSRLGALRIPSADGGGGSSVRELFAVVIRLATADANVAHILRNHFSVVEQFVRTPQHDQSRQWRQDVVGGAIIGLATAELESLQIGDVIPATTLTSDGDGYRLNGTKYYSTGTLYADFVLVRAADASGAPAAIIIPVKREGVELVDDWDGFGQRLTGSGTTILRNVRVEKPEVIFDAPNAGWGIKYSNSFAQLFLTAINAGILKAILRDATALIRRRTRNFYYAPAARPADDPVLQQTVGQISSNAFAAQSVVLAAADALDAATAAWNDDQPDSRPAAHAALLCAQAKVVVDELTIRSGSLLFDVGGASATSKSDNLDRHWRNARTLASHNPGTIKSRSIGDYEINGAPLPAKGYF